MTAYFDDLQRQVSDAAASNGHEAAFLLEVAKIEGRAQRAVEAVARLDGFPIDLKAKIADVIARSRTTAALECRLATKCSYLISDLHSIFHDVATRRIDTTFGVLSDDPEGTLKRLDGNGKNAFEDHIDECSECASLATLGKEAFCDTGTALERQWSAVNDLMVEGVPTEAWPK